MPTTRPSSSFWTGALIEVFDTFRRYELASGAKLNVKKSHGLSVSPWKTRTNLSIQLKWSSTSISVMGFHLNNGVDTVSWQAPIEQFNSVFASWTSRQLSFQGRALVTNTLGLSIFWYLSSFLSMPDSTVSRINSRAYSFIWNKKREWLARTTVTQRPSQGGLGLVDLKRKISALHVMWICHLVEHSALSLLFYFKHYLQAAFAGRTVDQILMLPKSV